MADKGKQISSAEFLAVFNDMRVGMAQVQTKLEEMDKRYAAAERRQDARILKNEQGVEKATASRNQIWGAATVLSVVFGGIGAAIIGFLNRVLHG